MYKKVKEEKFTPAEIDRLFEAKDTNKYYGVILMLIYTGCRTSELLDLKKSEVNIPGRCFNILEAKNKEGIRTVPIAEKVVPFFEYWYNLNGCEYLLSTPEGRHLEYRTYHAKYWAPLMKALNMNHRPHDTRHTCSSLLAAAKANEIAAYKIIGLKFQDGTDEELAELKAAINKI